MSNYPQSYKAEEIQQILQMAIARQSEQNNEQLTREQLWEIADELSIDKESILAAEQDWLQQKTIIHKKQNFILYRQKRLKEKIVRFLIVNGFLVTLNLISAATLSWSLYIILIWGLKLSLDVWQTMQVDGEAYERDFNNWYIRQEIKDSIGTIWYRVKKVWQT